MSIICSEHAESRCDSYPNYCYGCNAFVNPTNFDRIKYEISQMNTEEFIEFCGGKNCINVICSEVPVEYAYCSNNKGRDCGMCIEEYLGRKPK